MVSRKRSLSVTTAAVAPVASATAAVTTTAATTATAVSATATTASISAAATATTAAFTLRARFVDNQRAAHELLAIKRRDHFFGFSVVANFGKAETARLPGKTIAKERQ
jgi:activator of HSP90 ATPase